MSASLSSTDIIRPHYESLADQVYQSAAPATHRIGLSPSHREIYELGATLIFSDESFGEKMHTSELKRIGD
jgi:hypothetical protein